ncbi:MAG: exo-alpha-sialidase [Myxococcaceae bacterium]|jgi:hypothetical protein|nr:exo-alpha-sialidase [Myxococcaceae bacterium]
MTSRLLWVVVGVSCVLGCKAPSSVSCGEGTSLEGTTCVPSSVPRTCAPGTHDEGGACVVDLGRKVTCGAGTRLEADACVVDTLATPASPWAASKRVCREDASCFTFDFVSTAEGVVVALVENASLESSVAIYRQVGADFVLARRFEGSSKVAIAPGLAVKGSALYLAYTDYAPGGGQEAGTGDLMFATSTDLGRTWTAPRRLNAQPAERVLYNPHITVTGRDVDIAYTDSDFTTTQDTAWLHSSDDGATFDPPVQLSASQAGEVLGVAGPPLRFGATLEVPMQRTGSDPQTGSSLMAFEVLSLEPQPGAAPKRQLRRVKRVFYTRDFAFDPQPAMAANEAGVRCLAFVDAPSRDPSVYVVRSQGPLDGTQRPVLVRGGAGTGQAAPAVAVTAGGDCQLAWLDNRSGLWEVYEATLRADGSFTEPVKVSSGGFLEDGVTQQITARVQLQLEGGTRLLMWSDLSDALEGVRFSSAR